MAHDEVKRPLALFSTVAELADACRQLRLHLRRRKLAAEEELAAAWPADETTDEVWQWVFAYGQLMRLKGRAAAAPGGGTGPDAERAAMDVLGDKAEPVELADGTVVDVHPKGLLAIGWMDERDGYCGWLAERREAWVAALDGGYVPAAGEAPFDVVARIRTEEVRQLARMAAQATAPGPQLRELADADVAPWLDRSPVDLLRVLHAYLAVNVLRVHVGRKLSAGAAGAAGEERPSFAIMTARAADRYRVDARQIADDRSLPSLLLTVELAAPGDPALEDALS